jgi:hypothetical protein
VLPYSGPIATSELQTHPEVTMRIAPLRFLRAVTLACGYLAWADIVVAGCGDVTSDKEVSAADALRVLRAAVGQEVFLGCTYDDVMLDRGGEPEFGEVGLATGFVPAVISIPVVAGGSVFTSYLGFDCTGFTDSPPDFIVHFEAGASQLLRFFSIPSGNNSATMIVYDPSGNWSCDNNGSFSTPDPTIDFTNPKSGAYKVWIGSFGETGGATLFVTESPATHP